MFVILCAPVPESSGTPSRQSIWEDLLPSFRPSIHKRCLVAQCQANPLVPRQTRQCLGNVIQQLALCRRQWVIGFAGLVVGVIVRIVPVCELRLVRDRLRDAHSNAIRGPRQ